MDELKPCPFCGGEAELKQTGRKEITVRCRHCLVKRVQKYLSHDYEWLKAKQIEAWNNRV